MRTGAWGGLNREETRTERKGGAVTLENGEAERRRSRRRCGDRRRRRGEVCTVDR